MNLRGGNGVPGHQGTIPGARATSLPSYPLSPCAGAVRPGVIEREKQTAKRVCGNIVACERVRRRERHTEIEDSRRPTKTNASKEKMTERDRE